MAGNKLPTISIRGNEYVLVKDRVNAFNEAHPNGSINTKIVKFDDTNVVVRAVVTPDVTKPERKFTDYAAEIVGGEGVNKTSALENCSTSAVGRALAYMGIGVVDSIASADEMNKAGVSDRKATQPQKDYLVKLFIGFSRSQITTKDQAIKAMGQSGIDLDNLTMDEISQMINEIKETKKLPVEFDDDTPDMEPEKK